MMVKVRGWSMHKSDASTNIPLSVFQEMVLPGECTTMTLTLMEPVALEKFQRFALKMRNSTICAGVITDILTTDQ